MPFTVLAGASAAAKALAPTACTTIEEVGSTGVGALTLGFLALAVSTVVMVAKAASADAERRKYYFLNTFICGVATFSYFAMLSGQGWTAIAGCRQFFYARYIDWLITTPLLILDLGLVAGQDLVTIAAVVGADSELPARAAVPPPCRYRNAWQPARGWGGWTQQQAGRSRTLAVCCCGLGCGTASGDAERCGVRKFDWMLGSVMPASQLQDGSQVPAGWGRF